VEILRYSPIELLDAHDRLGEREAWRGSQARTLAKVLAESLGLSRLMRRALKEKRHGDLAGWM
jgi:hypothetical protein